MTPRTAATILCIALGLVCSYSGLSAHSGGLDANGGHYNRKTGEYRVHRPARAPASPPRAIQRQGILGENQVGTAATASRLLSGLTSEQKVDALLAVLVRRGLVTEAEIVAELPRGR